MNQEIELKINPEFKGLLQPLSEDKRLELEKRVLEDGCEDSIKSWKGFIVDGHNRYEICTRHGIEFSVGS